MGRSYAVQSVVADNKDCDGKDLLLSYRNIWCELPLACDVFDFCFKDWKRLGTLYDILANFGLSYEDVYCDSFIRQDFVSRMSEK